MLEAECAVTLQIITCLGLFPPFGLVGAVTAILLFDKKKKGNIIPVMAISQLSL